MSRKIDLRYDAVPSIHHIFNKDISERFIEDKNVLDIGCWTGIIEKMTVDIARKITGVDPDEAAIEQARKAVPNAHFEVAFASPLPYLKNEFDTVLLLEVIEHVPAGTESSVLAEINRVTKTGGYLILSTPSDNFFSVLLDPAFLLLRHRHYSLSKLESILDGAGFCVCEVYKTGGFVFLTKYLIEMICKHFFDIRPKFPQWVDEAIKYEYLDRGFATFHLVAQKKSIPKRLW